MALLTQTNFPRLWDWFQFWIGGSIDKRSFCRMDIKGSERILEVGCSTGNVAEAFKSLPQIDYVGLDIDEVVLKRARTKFRNYKNFQFTSTPFLDYQAGSQLFDIVLFAGMAHHIDDNTFKAFLKHSASILKKGGRVVVVDPLLPEPQDPGVFSSYSRLERGKYVRSGDQMLKLLRAQSDLELTKTEALFMGATPWSRPKVLRFGRYQLKSLNE